MSCSRFEITKSDIKKWLQQICQNGFPHIGYSAGININDDGCNACNHDYLACHLPVDLLQCVYGLVKHKFYFKMEFDFLRKEKRNFH